MVQINWQNVTGTQETEPQAVDKTSSPSCIYLRKDITKVETTSGTQTVTMWSYKEAALTAEEYEEYEQELAELESPAIEALRQENTQLMDSIADIYEQLAAQKEATTAVQAAIADVYEAVAAK